MGKISYIIGFVSFIIVTSCTDNKIQSLAGTWSIQSEVIDQPISSSFLAVGSRDSPWNHKEKLYFTKNLVEYPMGFSRNNNPLKSNFYSYQTRKKSILIGDEIIEINVNDNTLCINKNCFTKEEEGTNVLSQVKLKEFVHDDILSLEFVIDSAGLFYLNYSTINNSEPMELNNDLFTYIKLLCSRINLSDLNKSYNTEFVDTRQYKIELVLNKKAFSFTTNGKYGELPFELKALIHNLMKITVPQ